MLTESTFLCSHGHKVTGKPCQDYAFTQGDLMVLADGCSTSTNTDIGARILAKLVPQLEGVQLSTEFAVRYLTNHSNNICCMLELDPAATMKTTLVTAKYKDYYLDVNVFGDGCVAVKYKDGTIKIFEIKNEYNFPFYPVPYFNEHFSDELWEKLKDTTVLETTYDPNLNFTDLKATPINSYALKYGTTFHFSVSEVKAVATFSDGVTSIKNMNPIECINDIFSIKSTEPGFLHRKMNKLRKREDLEVRLEDDFSCCLAWFD